VKEYEARSRNYRAQFRWRHRAGRNSGVCKRTRFRTIAGGTTSIMAYLKTRAVGFLQGILKFQP
jgi:hypothetical protein